MVILNALDYALNGAWHPTASLLAYVCVLTGILGLSAAGGLIGDSLMFTGLYRSRRALATQQAFSWFTLGCFATFGSALYALVQIAR